MDKLVFIDVADSSTKGGSTDLEIFRLPNVEVFRGTWSVELSVSNCRPHAESPHVSECFRGWTISVVLRERWFSRGLIAAAEPKAAALAGEALTTGCSVLARFVGLGRLQSHRGHRQRMEQRAVLRERGPD